jgi:hypothetical protein
MIFMEFIRKRMIKIMLINMYGVGDITYILCEI